MSATVNYSITAVISLAACAALLVKSRNGDIARRAAAGAGLSALWALVLVGQAAFDTGLSWVMLLFEGLRYTAWIVMLRVLAPANVPEWSRRSCLALCVAPVIYSIAGWIGGYTGTYSLPLETVFGITGLALA